MKFKTLKVIAVAIPVLIATGIHPANADTKCVVFDPHDSAANIRATPNGSVINRLRNYRIVYVQYYRNDRQGRPWAYVAGWYNRKWRNWGWIFNDIIRC